MARRPPKKRREVKSLHSDEYQRFIEMLVERRAAAKLTQQEVADRLGWSQSLIAKIEKRERRVDLIELLRLASAIGFDAIRLVRDVRSSMVEHGELPD